MACLTAAAGEGGSAHPNDTSRRLLQIRELKFPHNDEEAGREEQSDQLLNFNNVYPS